MKRLVVLVVALLCLMVPASAHAYPLLKDACGTGSVIGGDAKQSTSSAGCSSGSADPINGPNGMLRKVSMIMAVLGGIAAVIVIIVSGFQYVIANGDAQKVARARSGIIGAAVGLVIIAAAETIVVFVVSKV